MAEFIDDPNLPLPLLVEGYPIVASPATNQLAARIAIESGEPDPTYVRKVDIVTNRPQDQPPETLPQLIEEYDGLLDTYAAACGAIVVKHRFGLARTPDDIRTDGIYDHPSIPEGYIVVSEVAAEPVERLGIRRSSEVGEIIRYTNAGLNIVIPDMRPEYFGHKEGNGDLLLDFDLHIWRANGDTRNYPDPRPPQHR